MRKKNNSLSDKKCLTIQLYLHFYENLSYQPTEKFISQLCENELKKFNAYSNKRKKEFLLGRLLLRFAIQQQNPIPTIPLHTIERDGLPPMVPFAEKHKLCFSISHSRSIVGVSIVKFDGEISLGLDIEYIKPVKNFSTTDFFCNENQLNNIANEKDLHKKMILYYHYWTQKEAYIKSQNKGIFSSDLKELEFFPSQKIISTTLSTTEISKNNAPQNHYKTSIYCSKPHQIETKIVSLGEDGAFNNNKKIKPNWGKFSF